MKFLNSDEGILFSENEAVSVVTERFGSDKNMSK